MSNTLFKKVTASAAALSIVLSVVAPVVGVRAADASVDAANRLASLGVIVDNSQDPSKYNLGSNITRREMLKVMMNLSSVEVTETCEGKFSDLPASDWGCKYAEAALKAGFIAANAKFRPNDMVTEAEALKMVMQARGVAAAEGVEPWGEAYRQAAVTAGILSAETTVSSNSAAKRSMVIVSADSAVSVTTGTSSEGDDTEVDLGDLLGDLFGEDGEDLETSSGTTSTGSTSTGTTVVVSGGNVEVTLNPASPAGTVAANSPRTVLMVVDVTAGDKDVVLNTANLKYTGQGTASSISELAVYYKGTKVTKWDSKTFSSSDLKSELSFNKDIVVKAGSTMTMEVTGKVAAPGSYTTHQIALENVTSSASYVGSTVSSNVLVPVTIGNTTTVEALNNKATDEVYVGKTVKLAGLKLSNTTEKEDAALKSVTFTINGTVDVRDISNLVVLVDGKEVASNLVVNSNDEVVASFDDIVIPKNKRIDVVLNGAVNGSVGKTIQAKILASSDIYVIGKSTNVALTVTNATNDVANLQTIKGAKINVSFTKGSKDSVKYNTSGVEFGTLKIKADSEYDVKSLKVNIVAANGKNVDETVKNVKLGGVSYDTVTTTTAFNKDFLFKDITLKANQELVLPVTVDINNDVNLNGTDLTATVSFVEIRDDVNREDYTGADLTKVLSTNSFDVKKVTVQAASFTLTSNTLTDRELVLANGAEVVLFNGKVQVGDSDNVTFTELTLNRDTTVVDIISNLTDVIDTVTLDVDGKKVNGTVSADKVEFSGVNAILTAGSRNVSVIVTAKLKSYDLLATKKIKLAFAATAKDSTVVEDSEGKEAGVSETVTISSMPLVTIQDRGSATFKVVTNGKYKDQIKNVVLAGSSAVKLAEIEAEAEEEDVIVKKLQFTVAGDYTSTFKTLSLVNAADGKAIEASAGVATLNGGVTTIEFKDVKLVEAANKVNLMLVADLNIVTTAGWVQSAALGNLVVEVAAPAASDVKGASSNKEVTFDRTGTVASTAVSVVPALVTVATQKTLAKDQDRSELKFAIDFGNNVLNNTDVNVTEVRLESAVVGGVTLRNDDNAAVTVTDNTLATLAVTGNNEISNGDVWSFLVPTWVGAREIRINPKGITFTVGGNSYTIVNDKVIDLGRYTE